MKTLDIPGIGPVSRVGLGTWQFGSREWGYGEDYASGEARAIVRRALDVGITFFDTAEVYGMGRSERILAQALGDDRERVCLASKIFPVLPVPPIVKNRAAASAERLAVRTVDLYQIHQANPVVPDSVIMPGMRELVADGRIRAVGVSNYSLDRWRKADEALGRPVVSNQVQFSLAHAAPLHDLVPFAAAQHRVVIAYSPLAQGLLGGKYGPDHRPGGVRALNPLFGPENLRRIGPLLDRLRDIAGGHHVAPAQVALAWLLAQPQVLVIPGASSVEQVEFNAEAADLELTSDEVAGLTEAATAFHPRSAVATGWDAVTGAVTGRVRSLLGR